VLGIVNSEIVKVTDENVHKEIDISPLTIPNTSVLISISFCTFSSVTFTISPLTIPNTSVLKEIDLNTEVLGIVNGKIVKVTDKNVQKEIDIYTEVLGIVNSEIVKVTDENVQKESIDIYFFLYILICYFYYFTINYS
jgi:hypothetical protein